MRDIPPGLRAHLSAGATTLARSWIITRTDGTRLGFTDHDRPLTIEGVACEPAAGFTASEVPAALGLAVSTTEVSGALVSPSLTESDIAAGLFDEARVETWLVNWSTPSERVLLEVGVIGEIIREGRAFKAEVRAMAHRLDQERGRLYQPTCDAELGDGRCGIDLNAAGRSGVGQVAAISSARRIVATGSGLPTDSLSRGMLTWLTGANTGARQEVREDGGPASPRALELWNPPGRPIAVGDQFRVVVGCDKRFATCRERFANSANFRGFPHMPGNDYATAYAVQGGRNDGGSQR